MTELELKEKLRTLIPVHDLIWSRGNTLTQCHYPGKDKPCDNPLHWWVSYSDILEIMKEFKDGNKV